MTDHYVTAITLVEKRGYSSPEVLIGCRCGDLFDSTAGYKFHLERVEDDSQN